MGISLDENRGASTNGNSRGKLGTFLQLRSGAGHFGGPSPGTARRIPEGFSHTGGLNHGRFEILDDCEMTRRPEDSDDFVEIRIAGSRELLANGARDSIVSDRLGGESP